MSPAHPKSLHQITRRFYRQLKAIDRKLIRLSAALAFPQAPAITVAPVPPSPVRQREYGDLTGAVMGALRSGPKTKREILTELHAQAFPFGGPPREVLDSVLYSRNFRRAGKLFWLA